MSSQRATVYLTAEALEILGDHDSLSGLINAMALRQPELIAALESAAKIINGMATDSLPACLKPSLEVVNQINRALHNASR